MSRVLLLAGALATVAGAGWAYFHRTPARRTPQALGLIVSPAAGRIIHIERTSARRVSFLKGDVLNELDVLDMAPPFQLVVIELNLLDVHVQRAPIGGVVVSQEYYPGAFANVLHTPNRHQLAATNEKLLTVLRGPETAVGVIQVAGTAARRIVSYVHEGQAVAKGAELGMITFGSQVVLILPEDAKLQVAEGERVVDGETCIATI